MAFKLDLASYELVFSKDNSLFANINNHVQVYQTDDLLKPILKIDRLKNPSYCCFSNDNRLVAIQNTSGHVLVCNIVNGNIVFESKTTNCETFGLYFLEGNTSQLISCDWNGNLYLIDLPKKDFRIIHVISNIIKFYKLKNVNEFIICTKLNDKLKVYKYNRELNTKTEFLQFSKKYYDFSCFSENENKFYYIVRTYKFKKTIYELYCYNFVNNHKQFIGFINLYTKDLATNDIKEFIIKNKKIFICLGESVFVYDLKTLCEINKYNFKYLSSINITDNAIVIGTWNNIIGLKRI